jgi:hypothetical protein
MAPSSGVHFSRRRGAQHNKALNANDLAREAVGWNAVFGGFTLLSYLIGSGV